MFTIPHIPPLIPLKNTNYRPPNTAIPQKKSTIYCWEYYDGETHNMKNSLVSYPTTPIQKAQEYKRRIPSGIFWFMAGLATKLMNVQYFQHILQSFLFAIKIIGYNTPLIPPHPHITQTKSDINIIQPPSPLINVLSPLAQSSPLLNKTSPHPLPHTPSLTNFTGTDGVVGADVCGQSLFLLINRIFFRIIIQAIFQMSSSADNLFQQIHGSMWQLQQELDRPRLRNNFTLNKVEIQLILTDNYLLLADPARTPTHYCRLAFDLKFELLYHPLLPNDDALGLPLGFRLEREHCGETLSFEGVHGSVVESWGLELEKKINQRNFHKLFKAKKKIGKGAFATVYLAERLRDHKMVAVKAFSKEKQYSGDKGRESLENEIKLMRRLNHPNLMKLEGVYETDNSIYVILEYLEGSQLNDLLKSSRKLDPDQIRSVLQHILRGLSHLAKHRIIHRDLKPENIMFRRDNSCDLAICDFGLATYADEEKYLFVRCGTPGFVAPQIINIRDMGTKSEPVSDVFSAGVIFHYLLFGCSVFDGKKYNEILSQNRSCEFNLAREMYSQLHPHVLDLLAAMLEKDPLRRITADAALNHLYFSSQMEIEKEQRVLLRDISNSSLSYKMRDEKDTLCSRKKEEKMLVESARKDSRRHFLY